MRRRQTPTASPANISTTQTLEGGLRYGHREEVTTRATNLDRIAVLS
jgi:hypothetical protein